MKKDKEEFNNEREKEKNKDQLKNESNEGKQEQFKKK